MPVYCNKGDAIKGEKIAAQGRKIGRIRIVPGSGAHRARATELEGDAYCVIERPMRAVRQGEQKPAH